MGNFFSKILPKTSALVVLFTAAAALTGCTGLRQASEEVPLLTKQTVLLNGKGTPFDEDYDILRQRPNKSILGQRPYLWAYGTGQRLGPNLFGRWLQNIGEPPVYFDSVAQLRSAQQLGLHYFNLGYYRVQTTTWHEHVGKRVHANYLIESGPQFRMSTVALRSTDRKMDSIVKHFPLPLKVGDPIVAEQLEEIQINVVKFLKEQGYYHAQTSWVNYDLDTNGGPNHTLFIAVVDPYGAGGDPRQKPIDAIAINPTFSYQKAGRSGAALDSTRTANGIDVVQRPQKFRPGFIDRQIFVQQGQMYDGTALQNTYKNLSQLGIFSSVELDVEDRDSAVAVRIKGVPLPRRGLMAALEGTGNSGSLGIGGSASWDNRNLFGGGEVLHLSVSGSVSEQRNSTNTTWLIDSRELAAGAQVRVPQLLLPQWLTPAESKYWRPRTQIAGQVSYQFRAQEFDRFSATALVEYQWQRARSKHALAPAGLNYSAISFATSAVDQQFLFVGFQNLVFPYSSYQYSVNTERNKSRYYFSAEVETAGHLWQWADIEAIQEAPVSAYLKGQFDFRSFTSLRKHRMWATRTLFGLTYTAPNSSAFVPFEKSFFMGGANDLRGWTAYHFGPGATSETVLSENRFFAAAPIKFLHSSEWRFTVYQAIKGAVFVDLGNMWLWDRSYGPDLSPEQQAAIDVGRFQWNRAWQELGMNTGYGLRYDLEFFILRADIGLQVYHPGADNRSRWVVSQPQWGDLNLALGIGYPF